MEMEWETSAVGYRGFQIWVAPLRGDWMASVNALPEGRGTLYTAGPAEGHILGPFDSREAAIEGGKRYIDEKQQQRRQQNK